MRERRVNKLRPHVESLEGKRLLSATVTAHRASHSQAHVAMSASGASQVPKFTFERITNPTPKNAILTPPFKQLLVQSRAPIPGQVYNVLSVSMRNSTARTFDASSNLRVSLTGQLKTFPILTGTDVWTPGEVRVFYVLTKKYYPIRPVTSAGFQFSIEGSHGVAIPGPSGIFLRLTYKPATINKVINQIVAHGIGSKGHELGLPDTSIWEFIPSRIYTVPL